MAFSNALPVITDATKKSSFGAMVFEEHFTGTDINKAVWDAGYFFNDWAVKNYDCTTYSDAQGTQRSVLRIWPQYDANLVGQSGVNNGFPTREITTGNPGFRQTYGYFEICAKLNVGQGVAPVFQAQNPNGQQLKLLETYPSGPADYHDTAGHPNNYVASTWRGLNDRDNAWASFLSGQVANRPLLDTDFHVYGVEWTPDYAAYYFDGILIGTHWHTGQVTSPMMICLGLWFGGAGGNPDSTTPQGASNAIEIDYVRTWLDASKGSASGPAASGGGAATGAGPAQNANGTNSYPTLKSSGLLGLHSHRQYNGGGAAEATYNYSLFRDWDCEGLHCFSIWNSDGSINETIVEQVYAGHARHGAKVIKCFGSVPTWASRRPTEANVRYPNVPGGLSGPADLTAYEDYCYRFIKRFRNYLWAVEGWNEPYPSTASPSDPEWPQFTTQSQTELADTQKALYKAAKRVDPSLPVFSPCQAYVSGIDDVLAATTSQGEPISNFFDVVSWHPYNRSASGFEGVTLQDEAQNVRNVIRNAGLDFPIADTEHGWLAAPKEGGDAWRAMTSQQRAQVVYDTFAKAREIGLLCICFYSHETDLLGTPETDTVMAAGLQSVYANLDNKTYGRVGGAGTGSTTGGTSGNTGSTGSTGSTTGAPYTGGNQLRYIRNYINGNSINAGNHWVEIQAIDLNGTNVALNKAVTMSQIEGNSAPASILVDGSTATDPYINSATGLQYAQVDLGSRLAIKEIRVWHYYGDGRTYNGNLTQISDDAVSWTTIDDSTYQETSAGRTVALSAGATSPGQPGSGSGAQAATYAAGDAFTVRYQNGKIEYLHNGVVKRTVDNVGLARTFYLDSSFYSVGAQLQALSFGRVGTVDWASITGAGKPEDGATRGAILKPPSQGGNVQGQITADTAQVFLAPKAITNDYIGDVVKSDNFVPGDGGKGWSIDKLGNAEFNNGIFRGTLAANIVKAGNIVLNSVTQFDRVSTSLVNGTTFTYTIDMANDGKLVILAFISFSYSGIASDSVMSMSMTLDGAGAGGNSQTGYVPATASLIYGQDLTAGAHSFTFTANHNQANGTHPVNIILLRSYR